MGTQAIEEARKISESEELKKAETKELQDTIKEMCKKAGWSTTSKLPSFIFDETNPYEDEDELRTFKEKLKKQLSRSTTEPDLLKSYIKIISQHEDMKKASIILPRYISSKTLNPSVEDEIKKISKEIHDQIEKNHKE